MGLFTAFNKGAEFADNIRIQGAFKGNNQINNFIDPGPFPGAEFRLSMGTKINIPVLAREAQKEPFLPLAAKF